MPKNVNFFRASTVRLLKFISDHPTGRFYEKDVSDKAGVSRGATNQTLKLLLGMGLVRREKQGRMFFYAFDASSPTGRQFRVLLNVMEVEPVVRRIREHAKEAILFGSCGSGTDGSESDIDLFVLSEDAKRVRELIGDAAKEVERHISLQVMSSAEYARLKQEKSPFLERVERGIVLWQK